MLRQLAGHLLVLAALSAAVPSIADTNQTANRRRSLRFPRTANMWRTWFAKPTSIKTPTLLRSGSHTATSRRWQVTRNQEERQLAALVTRQPLARVQ
jgi:hypothetical protein